MITNFEHETKKLTEREFEALNTMILILLDKRKKNPIKAPELLAKINSLVCEKIAASSIRKLTSYLRRMSILPVIASKYGYYVSSNQSELKKQINSLNERASAIKAAATGLTAFVKYQS